MTPATPPESVVHRRAIEALRSGVPNSDAVRVLGAHQPTIEEAFRARLSAAAEGANVSGLVVAGDFGSGKSHLLEYLGRQALDARFVASKVVISKETPLHDLGKVFRTAVDSVRLPDRVGAALPELVEKLGRDREAAERLSRALHDPESGLDDRFAATLFLLQNTRADAEFADRIVRFWGGDPISVAELRKELKAAGEGATYALAPVSKGALALQRFRFVARLLREVGYAGWVLLFDEVELIGRYSLLQRGRSYAEIARWANGFEDEPLPGILTVMAITLDFDAGVLYGKNDVDEIPNRIRLRPRDDSELLAARAERGMRTLEQDRLVLSRPSAEDLLRAHRLLRDVHGTAYSWRPEELVRSDTSVQWPMRYYVRSWINEWDLRRLYPGYRPDIEVRRLGSDYSEDLDLEGPDPEADAPQDGS